MRHRRLITQLILLTVVVGAQFACPKNREPSKVKDVELTHLRLGAGNLTQDVWDDTIYQEALKIADDQWEVTIPIVDLLTLAGYTNPIYLTFRMWVSIEPAEGFRLHDVSHDGYVVKAYQNGTRVPTRPYLSISTHIVEDKTIFHFPLNFNDPTYQTAETHIYRIDFYNCSEDCAGYEDNRALGLADRVTVTVNYTP